MEWNEAARVEEDDHDEDAMTWKRDGKFRMD